MRKNRQQKYWLPASKSPRRMKPAFSGTILHLFSCGIRFTSRQRADAGFSCRPCCKPDLVAEFGGLHLSGICPLLLPSSNMA